MNIMEILNPILMPVLAIGGMGLFFGIGLSIAAKKFAVPVDERVEQLKTYLPGANCGGCGFAGCDAFAKAIASGDAKLNGCPVSNEEQVQGMASVMGMVAEAGEKTVAVVRCKGTKTIAKEKYAYTGPQTCEAAHLVHGGPKGCKYGCLGFGSCVHVCSFDALKVVDGLVTVDENKCKSCGACVTACPRNLIYIGSAEVRYQVKCMSNDKGKDVKQNCKSGCIGCGICLKQCEVGAISLDKQLATIDASKCIGCGKCKEKCPTKVIEND